MLTEHWLYGISACLIMAFGLRAVLLNDSLLQRIIALNVMGTGVFMMLITIAYRGPDAAPDPIPHALVLTGIVVAVSATALALTLLRRLNDEQDND
jgi:multicomponent Na+:H+ antiporter subunit C